MKVFTCTNHNVHYPVGGASIIVAEDEVSARITLDKQLAWHGLKQYKDHAYTLDEIKLDRPVAIVLNTGDY